jgi:hypothetical protein
MSTKIPKGERSPAQSERFKDAARELGCDEDSVHFEEKLKKVAAHKSLGPQKKPGKKPQK